MYFKYKTRALTPTIPTRLKETLNWEVNMVFWVYKITVNYKVLNRYWCKPTSNYIKHQTFRCTIRVVIVSHHQYMLKCIPCLYYIVSVKSNHFQSGSKSWYWMVVYCVSGGLGRPYYLYFTLAICIRFQPSVN